MNGFQQSPEEQALERVAEGLPGVKLAAEAVGLVNHQQLLRDHAKRVRDSHRAQMKALGLELPEEADMGADDMGITICGDNCFNQPKPEPVPITSPPPPPVPPPSPATEPAAPSTTATPLWKKALVTAALVGSGAGAGAGIPWLAGAFDKPAAVQSQYGLDLQKFVPGVESPK